MIRAKMFSRDQRLVTSILILGVSALLIGWLAIRQAEQHLLKSEATATAIHWADFLENNLSDLGEIMTAGLISQSDQRVFDFAREAGRVMSYQVIKPDGIVALSSWSGDILGARTDPAIIRTIRSGTVLTRLTDNELPGDKRETLGVAYVPIMEGGSFRGAIKVYVEMTAKAAEFRVIGSYAFAGLVVFLVVLGSLCAVLVWKNMRERVRAEKVTGALKRQNELILNSAGEGIYGLDLDGCTTFANPAAAKMVGWETGDLIGKPQHAILHHTKVDGSPYPREECPIYAALKDGSVHHVDTEVFWRKDGTSFPVEYVSSPIRDENGALTGAVVVFSDITARSQAQDQQRRAEGRLRDAIESIADGFVLFDANDRVELWNPRFADLYPELAELLPTKPTAEALFRERVRAGAVGESDVPVDEYVRWRMAARQKQGDAPAIHRHNDGRWIRTTERRTSDGGIVAVSTDISELKIREMELKAAMEQAELANRSKSEFLANMSHELRTPLNAVIGFSETMQQEMFGPLGNERYKQYAKDIFDSGSHLLSLISDILDLSKVEAGKFDLNEQELDLAQAVGACRRITEQRAKEAGVTLATRLGSDLPRLWADERAVKQIILNLLSNAVKFTPAGGKVTVHAGIDEDGCFVLSVSDTGIGIGADDIPKILMPFSQVDSSFSRQQEGTGLGLSLIKSLIEMHGGTIELESELGDGTIVTVRFPAERVLHRPAGPTSDDDRRAAAE
jgi:PAS domain S-box-containing protein